MSSLNLQKILDESETHTHTRARAHRICHFLSRPKHYRTDATCTPFNVFVFTPIFLLVRPCTFSSLVSPSFPFLIFKLDNSLFHTHTHFIIFTSLSVLFPSFSTPLSSLSLSLSLFLSQVVQMFKQLLSVSDINLSIYFF